MIALPFAVGSKQARNLKENTENLVNFYVDISDPSSKNNTSLIGTPGAELFATVPKSPILGSIEFKGSLYIVTPSKFYRVDTDSTITELGSVGYAITDRVSMAHNGIQIVMCSGDAYSYDPSAATNQFTQITDPLYFRSSSVTFQDGYFIFVRDKTNDFFITNLYSVNFISTDIAQAESDPDVLISAVSNNSQLWLFGQDSIEIWYNSGDVDFPFLRTQGSVIQRGCKDKNTVAKLDNNLVWVGDDGSVLMSRGANFFKISTKAEDYQLAKNNYTNMEAFSYFEEGHHFYCLTIDNKITMVYDAKTKQWHRRKTTDLDRWRIGNIIKVGDINYGLDYINGNIYKISLDYGAENNVPIERIGISAPINKGVDYFTLSAFQLDMETGNTILSDSPAVDGEQIDKNTEILLEFSRDGGKTYSYKKAASIGVEGNFTNRVIWRRLGRHRDLTIKISTKIKSPIHIIGAFGELND